METSYALATPKEEEEVNIVFVYVGRWLSLLFRGIVVVFVKVCNRMNKHGKALSAIKNNQKYSKKFILLDFVFY